MQELVSLIMPIISEEYYEESVMSICMQTYKNWELYILACCSINKIEEIIAKLKEPRIHLIQLEENIGMLQAFAEGLKLSSGVYVIRHDPDDISLPRRIEQQVNYFKEHDEVGMVSCSIKAFTNDYEYKKQCENINKVQNFNSSNQDIDKSILGGNYHIIFPALMIRKALFNDINILYKKTAFVDEAELVLNLLKKSSIKKIDDILYYYRRHSNAYHSINNIERIKYLRIILDDKELMNSIKYREFRNELKNIKIEKISNNKSSTFRVLMLIDELNIGGTETYVLNITKALMKRGVYVVIASCGGISEELFMLHGIKVSIISMNIKFKAIKEIKHIIDIENINLLHCHLNKSMMLGSEMYKKYNIPYIITLHGMFYSKEILLSTCAQAKVIIAVSSPVKSLFIDNIGAQFQGILRVISNGVDTEIFKQGTFHKPIRQELGISKDAFVIVYCSRLGWGKGAIAEQVISSFKEISLKHRDIYCIIIGEGDKKENIIRKAEEINLFLNRTSIHVIGARYDVLSYYLESDLIIGTGRVALEALSCEKVVIANGSGGYVGIVSQENKEEIWNTYFGDHKCNIDTNNRSLTKSIEYLIEFPQNRMELGKWGRKWCIENFEEGKVANEIIGLYKDILKLE